MNGIATRFKKVHGMSHTQTHKAWGNMKDRCERSTHPAYAEYEGRGITFCERWQKFDNFFSDMGECPPGLTLERIDNDKGYSPENCKWATRSEQQRNRRACNYLTIDGVKRCLLEWAKIAGINRRTIYGRLSQGKTPKEAVFTPIKKYKPQKA